MKETVRLQGRDLTPKDIEFIRHLIAEHPDWHRKRLSIELCHAWNWRNAKGDIKDMASRSLLVKLDERGWIKLPARRRAPPNRMKQRRIADVDHNTTPIDQGLKDLQPLEIVNVVQDPKHKDLYAYLLNRYHYLGFRGAVGENMQYLIRDRCQRPLACLLFGSSAWQAKERDRYIGWEASTRECNIQLTTNNTRFLILPWIRIPHLASHVLSRIARQIGRDWQARYAHPLYMLETFVEDNRFAGTCYRAANWRAVGKTQGRSRNDRHHRLQVPTKTIYVYPLVNKFQLRLQTYPWSGS